MVLHQLLRKREDLLAHRRWTWLEMGLWDLRPVLPPRAPPHCASLTHLIGISGLEGKSIDFSLIPADADLHPVLRAEQSEEGRSADERRRVDR